MRQNPHAMRGNERTYANVGFVQPDFEYTCSERRPWKFRKRSIRDRLHDPLDLILSEHTRHESQYAAITRFAVGHRGQRVATAAVARHRDTQWPIAGERFERVLVNTLINI